MTDYNAADRKSIRAAEKAAEIAERSRGEVVTALMSTKPGRDYVWAKLGYAGVFHTSFSTDALQMAFNEGQRNQGLLLIHDLMEFCPDLFILAMREHNERRDASRPHPASSDAGERSLSEDAGGDDQGPADDTA